MEVFKTVEFMLLAGKEDSKALCIKDPLPGITAEFPVCAIDKTFDGLVTGNALVALLNLLLRKFEAVSLSECLDANDSPELGFGEDLGNVVCAF